MRRLRAPLFARPRSVLSAEAALIVGLLFACLAEAPLAQTESASLSVGGGSLSYRATHVVVTKETASFLGDVEVRFLGRRIRCDSLVVWHRDEETSALENSAGLVAFDRRVQELYAEGTVLFEDGRGKDAIRCDRLYFDLTREVGFVLNAEISATVANEQRTQDLQIRASELRLLGKSRIEALETKLGLGRFVETGFNLESERVLLLDDSDTEGNVRRLEASGNRVGYGRFPLLWLPDFALDTRRDSSLFQVQDVRMVQSAEFGFAPGITFGSSFKTEDVRVDAFFDFDWFSRRGVGLGPRFIIEGEEHFTQLDLRYQRDEGADRAFGVPSTRDRGRAALYHRHLLPGEVILDAEAHAFSDRGFYPTFEERLDKGEKPPETLLHFRRAFDRHRVAALFSHRSGDFLTATEARPELRYDLVSQSLGQAIDQEILLNATVRLGNMRRRYDEATDIRQQTALRADVDTLVETSFAAGPLRFRPFAGVRASWFERDLSRDRERTRFGWTHGMTISADLWKDFAASGGLFDLDGLRHRILPEITYQEVLGVDAASDELIPFDDVEAFDEERFLAFRLRQLLLTQRTRGGRTSQETILDLEIEQRLQLTGTPRDDGDLWAPLDVDLLLRLGPAVDLVIDFEYDWDSGIDVFNAGIGWIPDENLAIFTGYRFFVDEYEAFFVETRVDLDEKWLFRLRSSFDFVTTRSLDHRLSITRRGRDWASEFIVGYDAGEEDFFFGVSLVPLFAFDEDEEAPVLQSEPRFGPVRNRLYR